MQMSSYQKKVAELEASGSIKKVLHVKYTGKEKTLAGNYALKGGARRLKKDGEIITLTTKQISDDQDLLNELIEAGSLPKIKK